MNGDKAKSHGFSVLAAESKTSILLTGLAERGRGDASDLQ
jgi:hypothetical protein